MPWTLFIALLMISQRSDLQLGVDPHPPRLAAVRPGRRRAARRGAAQRRRGGRCWRSRSLYLALMPFSIASYGRVKRRRAAPVAASARRRRRTARAEADGHRAAEARLGGPGAALERGDDLASVAAGQRHDQRQQCKPNRARVTSGCEHRTILSSCASPIGCNVRSMQCSIMLVKRFRSLIVLYIAIAKRLISQGIFG